MEKSKRTFRGSYPAYALTYFFFYWSLGVFTSVLSMYLTGIGKSKAEMSFIMSASSLFGVVLTRSWGISMISCESRGLSVR